MSPTSGSIPAVASSTPASPYGPPTLDERIYYTDVIAIVRPLSAQRGTITVQDAGGQSSYSPLVQYRYQVIEYLKGEGDSEIIVNANDFSISESSVQQALQAAERNLAAQTFILAGKEGVVFLQGTEYPARVVDISRKVNETDWRQYNAQAGLMSASGSVVSASNDFSAAFASSEGSEGLSIGELRERVDAMEALLKEGEGIGGYERCIESMLLHENYLRTREFPGVFDIEPTSSGLPSGSRIDEFSYSYPRQWFTGGNAPLFDYGANEVTTTRPLPAGAYEVQRHFQRAEWMPCDYVPPPSTWRYNFESTEGILHEAFFDPVDIDEAVEAGKGNGILKPDTFDAEDSSSTTIERIEWSSGSVRLELVPHDALSGQRIDFIAPDGSVSLSLNFDDAVEIEEDGATLLGWGVCEQPWEDGDLLMLRIAAGVPDDGMQPTNDAECL